MKPFSQWSLPEIEKEFGVEWQHPSTIPQSLLNADGVDELSQTQMDNLKQLQVDLIEHVHGWNEYELRFKCIALILAMAEFDQEAYQSFWLRHISVPYQNKCLSGNVDFMVATGRRAPKQPHFLLHQHKKDVSSSGDPLAQLLIAMIAAQILNEGQNPIYGAYVMGRSWLFVVLDGQKYGVSLAYDATKDEIRGIFRILKKVRLIIEEQIRQDG